MTTTNPEVAPVTHSLLQQIANREAVITVVGVGYVGLPLGVVLAETGFKVNGLDTSPARVTELTRGESPIVDISSDRLKKQVDDGKFEPTLEASVLGESDIVFICVPTPLSLHKRPDTSFIESAAHTIAKHLHAGMMVILESTTYPGTTVELIKPILEETGLKAGEDFHLAFSPERVDPGNEHYDISNTAKVIGGLTPACTDLACKVYASVSSDEFVVPVSSPTEAEFVKLLENTFRSVNIALVNELAQLAHRMGVNIWEIIDAAATKPYGFLPFYPGPGVGGHCIPVDPYYLLWKAREYDFYSKFIELAAETNNNMPAYVLNQIFRILNRQEKSIKGSKILCLGVTFKANISDNRNSPAMHVLELLADKGADLQYCDPFVPKITLGESHHDFNSMLAHEITIEATELSADALAEADMVILLVNHRQFDIDFIVKHSPLLYDTRNMTKDLDPRPGHVFVL